MFAKLVMTNRWLVLRGEDKLWVSLSDPLRWPTWWKAARSVEAAPEAGSADYLVRWASPWCQTLKIPLRLAHVALAEHIECHFGASLGYRANLILELGDDQGATLTIRTEIRFRAPLTRAIAPLLCPFIKLLYFTSLHRALAQLGRQIGVRLACTEEWAGLQKKHRSSTWRH